MPIRLVSSLIHQSLSIVLFALGCAACSSAPLDTSDDDEGALTNATTGDGNAATGAAAGASSIQIVCLGAVRSGERIAIDVPRGAVGFTLTVAAANGPDDALGVRQLVTPSGRAVVDEYTPEGGTRPLGRGSRGAASVAVPATTRMTGGSEPIAGRWSAILEGPPGAEVTLRAQTTADGAFHGGAMDLDVYVPSGLVVADPEAPHTIDGQSAAHDASIAARVDAFFAYLEHYVGIGRGAVRFHAIDASYRTATSGDARARLLAAPREPHAGLAIVLTNEMSYDGGGTLLGYSVGLPGTLDGVGNPRSAIGVALYEDGSAKNDALTIFHELGHFSGLMHTSEEDGTLDLLDDTPACAGKSACEDTTNLMASAGPEGGLVLSPSQVRVFRGAPLYRAR